MDVTTQAVDNLVTQFSSALDFYRELVQNSIDAGSSTVEIWLDFLPAEDGGALGVIEIHVDDFGDGMNEEVIDEQLTTLFSSTKEDDLTKIGKFGIGFVSVFALEPKGVLVQTGRDGEWWEVFFDQDRSFFKSPLDTPVAGTQITLFLEGDRARYTELVADSHKTIDHWCRHSEAEITFEDRASLDAELVVINKPFAVEGECPTRFSREGTEIVLAYSLSPRWGFYNRGLALAVAEGKTDLVPPRLGHVAFRMKSRYLEHTLSRETVMRDANYDKAMAVVFEAADGALRTALIGAITTLVQAVTTPDERGQRRRFTAAERGRYFDLMYFLAREGPDAVEAHLQVPLLVGFDGKAYTLAEACKAAAGDERVYVDHEASDLIDHLLEQGTPVFLVSSPQEVAAAGGGREFEPVSRVIAHALSHEFSVARAVEEVMEKLRGERPVSAWVKATEMIARPVEVLVGVEILEDSRAGQLVARAQELLGVFASGPAAAIRGALRRLQNVMNYGLDVPDWARPRLGYGKLTPARLHGSISSQMPLFVVAHEVAPLMALPGPDMASRHSTRPEAAVNCDHPHFRTLLRFAEREPDMAAYCLAKALVLQGGSGLEIDGALMAAALAPRSDVSASVDSSLRS